MTESIQDGEIKGNTHLLNAVTTAILFYCLASLLQHGITYSYSVTFSFSSAEPNFFSPPTTIGFCIGIYRFVTQTSREFPTKEHVLLKKNPTKLPVCNFLKHPYF